MGQKQIILRGAFILTAAGFVSRIMGFFYRIFLSRIIGAEGLGLYQLIFPIFGFAMAFSANGIQTSISHYVSGNNALKDTKGTREFFFSGLSLALLLSLLASLFIWRHADFLAFSYLKEARCAQLLRYMAFAIPFAALHSCILGYFMGLKRTEIPAVSQFLEQCIRIASSFLCYQILLEKNLTITPLVAVIGLLCSEIISSLFTLTLLVLEFSKKPPLFLCPSFSKIRNLGKMAAPLSGNRLLISFLQSIEALLIPSRLRLFGYTSSEALSQYGILNGMALPLVLFPSAITGAVSMMLLPTVSEAHTLDHKREISRTVEATIQGSLLLGIFCTGIFLLFGPDLGLLLFDNPKAGDYILILGWICPFLYLGSTLTSILNGLEKTMTTFWQHALGLGIRIFFVWFCIPRFGMTSYLIGLLISQLTMAFLAVFSLKKQVSFHFRPWNNLVLPLASLLLGAAAAELGNLLFQYFSLSAFYALLFRGILFSLVYVILLFHTLRE